MTTLGTQTRPPAANAEGLTPHQRAWLADLAARRNPWDRHRRGSGGWAVCNALFRRGLVDVVGRLTPAGREVVAVPAVDQDERDDVL